MKTTVSYATAHACGWSAECPHCGEIEKFMDDCSWPVGVDVECLGCNHKFSIDDVWGKP